MTPLKIEMGLRIAAARARISRYRRSQTALAADVGVSRTHLSHWENGQASPTAANLWKLAEALEVTPGWILSGEGENRPVEKPADTSVGAVEKFLASVESIAKSLRGIPWDRIADSLEIIAGELSRKP